MSRTYRCRHLPPTRDGSGSLITKVSDGARGFSWRRMQAIAEAVVEAEFGPFPSPGRRMVRSKGLTHTIHTQPVYQTNLWFGKPFTFMQNPGTKVVLPGRWMKTWEAWAWQQEVNRVERDLVTPISSWHPLQRRGPAGSRKKFERVQANRGMRHAARQTLRSSDLTDDWDGHMPHRRTYFDWWSIY